MASFDAFFRKENIFLVVGATNNKEKYGSKVFLDLKEADYNVIAINHKAQGEIHGTPAYSSVTAFLEKIEHLFNEKKRQETHAKIVLVFVIPPAATMAILKEAVEHHITKAWFQPGAESDEAIAFCKAHSIEEVHGACIMIEKEKKGTS